MTPQPVPKIPPMAPCQLRPPSLCLPCLHDRCEVPGQSRKRPGRRTWKYQSGNVNKEIVHKRHAVTQTASSDLSLKESFADVSVKLGEVDMAKHRLKTKLLPECREVSFVSENNQKMLPCFSSQRILSLTHSSNNSQSLKAPPPGMTGFPVRGFKTLVAKLWDML